VLRWSTSEFASCPFASLLPAPLAALKLFFPPIFSLNVQLSICNSLLSPLLASQAKNASVTGHPARMRVLRSGAARDPSVHPSPFLSNTSALFVHSRKVKFSRKSFSFNRLRTLAQKHRGWGVLSIPIWNSSLVTRHFLPIQSPRLIQGAA